MSALAEAASLYASAAMVFVAAVWASNQAFNLAHYDEPWNQSGAIMRRMWRKAKRWWRGWW